MTYKDLLMLISPVEVRYEAKSDPSECFVRDEGQWPDYLVFGDSAESQLVALHEALHLYVSGATFWHEELVIALERELYLRFLPDAYKGGSILFADSVTREFSSRQRRDFWEEALDMIEGHGDGHARHCLNRMLRMIYQAESDVDPRGDDSYEHQFSPLCPSEAERYHQLLQIPCRN